MQESQEVPEEAAEWKINEGEQKNRLQMTKEPVRPEDIIMAEESEKDEILMQPTTMMPEITDDMLNVDDDTSDDEASQEKENVSEKRDFDHVTSFIEQEIAKMTAKIRDWRRSWIWLRQEKMPDISLPEDLDSEEDDSEIERNKTYKRAYKRTESYIFIFHTGKGYGGSDLQGI